jgi:hypothetical protein
MVKVSLLKSMLFHEFCCVTDNSISRVRPGQAELPTNSWVGGLRFFEEKNLLLIIMPF